MVRRGDTKKIPGTEGYVGEYVTKLVSGYRFVIPAEFREKLGKRFVLTRGYEGALILVDFSHWNKLIAPIKEASFLDRNIRETLRYLVSSAFYLEPDAQGRVVIPASLRSFMGISKSSIGTQLAVIGVFNWIEVWIKERWDSHIQNLTDKADLIASEVANLLDSKMS